MAPEVSGEDVNEGDGDDVSKALHPATLTAQSSSEVEETLRLLWALCQAQNGLRQEEELLHQASTVQEEVARQCDALRHELLHAEAELQESRHATVPPSPRSLEDDSEEAGCEDDHELRRARQDHDELERALHQAEIRLREAQHPEQYADGDSADHPEDTGFTQPEEENAEALLAEIRSLRRREQDAAEARRLRQDELLHQLHLLEARGRDERWALREELTEVCVQAEVIHSEISAERKAREATLERLREEEVYLVGQVSEVQEEVDHVSRSSYWSVHSESICSDWSEVARARAALEPFDISTPRGQVNGLSPAAQSEPSPGRASLRSELRGSRRERARGSLAAYRPLQQGEASKQDAGRPSEASAAGGPGRSRPRGERHRSSLASFRSVDRPGQSKAGDLQANAQGGSSARLSVIGEEVAEAPGSCEAESGQLDQRMVEEENGKHGTPQDCKDSAMEACHSNAEKRSQVGGVPEDGAAARCRGVLEWTVRPESASTIAQSSPRWAGPSLFQVQQLATGRKVFCLSQTPGGGAWKGLSIPLLAIAAVREDKEDPLGLVFIVRYKAVGERVQVYFRAATKDNRSSWISSLCEAIHEARACAKPVKVVEEPQSALSIS